MNLISEISLSNDGEIVELKTATCSDKRCNVRTLKGVAAGALILALLVFDSCRDNGIGPVIGPGPRDYSWKMDTLRTEFNILTGFWGSSPNDVWAGGNGGAVENFLWHFDGTKWITWLEYHPQTTWCTAQTMIEKRKHEYFSLMTIRAC